MKGRFSVLNPTNKVCTKCKVGKMLTEFHKSKNSCDGLSWECKVCSRERSLAWERSNSERVNEAHRARYKINPEKSKAASRAWSKAHPEKGRAASRKWRDANLAFDKVRQAAWHKRNRALCTSYVSARKAQKLMATPIWANHGAIGIFYAAAAVKTKVLGQKHHVDHIVPLISKRVCGLHVENNLRVIPAIENIRKGNRVWPDMP